MAHEVYHLRNGDHIEKISALIERLKQWRKFTEKELESLVKDFEKTPREEWSLHRVDLFTKSGVADILKSIGEKFAENPKILINVISSIGNLVKWYKLEPADPLCNLFLKNKENKKSRFAGYRRIQEKEVHGSGSLAEKVILSLDGVARNSRRLFRQRIKPEFPRVGYACKRRNRVNG